MKKRLRSLIGVIIAIAMLLPTVLPVATVAAEDVTPTQTQGKYGFVDFPTGWSAPAMSHAVENGLLYGKSENRIHPTDNLTRAEMATIINRAFGSTVEKDISEFSDVSEDAWYYKEIKKAYNMQTLYGDAGKTMRPDAFIIREEAIAIVARAMVLSGYSASNLDRFNDKAEIADWAVDSLASMAANGYVNGDEKSNMNPKAYITREEFAQLLYNIIKHYYDADNKQETYQGNLMLNKPNISLEKITVNGDLVLGDGVGESVITLTDIKITGRLLVRGAKQITLKNVTADGGVTVKNVNGTVHFDNYREEKVFDGVIEHTTVTYKQKAPAGGGGGGGGGGTPPTPTTASYKVEHYQENLDGTYSVFETENLTGTIGASVTAVAKSYTGFSEDTSNPSRVASGTVLSDGSLVLKLFYNRNTYTVTFDFGGATLDPTTQTSKTDKYGATVVLPTTGFTNGALNFAGWFTEPNGAGTQVTEVVIGAANTTVYAYWTAQNTYKVEHYQENIDGTYTIVSADTQILTEDAGNSVTATPKTYEGFHENTSHPSRVPSGTVLADNSLVLKLYYDRNTYTFTFDAQGGTISGTPKTVYKYGETLDLPTPVKGTDTFGGWFTGVNGTGTPITNASVLGTDVTGDVTVYAYWIAGVTPPTPTTAGYVVEHYQENLDGTYSVFETENLTGTIGAPVNATPKTYTGFYENAAHASRIPSGTVLADGTLTLKLYYARNTYTFTFDAQGGTISGTPKTAYKYGETLDLPTPVKGTDTFGGWFTGVIGTGTPITNASVLGTDVTGDVTVYAYWISGAIPTGTYTVEHYKEDLAGAWVLAETDPSQSAPVGTVLTAATYQKTYPGFTLDAINSPDVTVASENAYVLVIKYARNSYDVTYNFGEAGGSHTVTLKYEENVDLSYVPSVTVPNKYFAGWYDAPVGGTQVTTLTTPVDGTTIYAYWSNNPGYVIEHYQQNADDDGYTLVYHEVKNDIEEGNLATIPAASYPFFTEITHAETLLTGTVTATPQLVLKRYFNRVTYTVTFDYQGANGGNALVSQTYKHEQTENLPAPTKTGYEFAGWFTAPVGGTLIADNSKITSGGTIYAQWTPALVDFTVKHYKQEIDGTYPSVPASESTQQAYTEDVVNASDYDITLDGFTFDSSSPSVTILPDGSAVLEIFYTRNSYDVTYNFGEAGGSHTVTLKYEEGVDLSYVPAVTVPNKYFAGWYTAPTGGTQVTSLTTPINGTTIYAQWSENPTYTVIHYKEALNGSYPESDAVVEYIQAGLNAPVNAVYKTYADAAFVGFTANTAHPSKVESGINDGSLVLKLFYDRERYTVSFNVDGGSAVADRIYKFGEAFELPVTTKQGYAVEGWYRSSSFDAASKVNAGDLAGTSFEDGTLYVKWAPVPVDFKVEHYKQEIDGTYPSVPAHSATYQEYTDTVVAALDYKTDFAGFTFDSTSPSVTVLPDGSAVLVIKYTRNSYNVTYNFGEAGGANTVTLKYEENVDLTYVPSVTVPNKYFAGWYTDSTCTTEVTSLATPIGGTTIYAKWADNPSYTVKHYREDLSGAYPESDAVVEYIQAGLNASVNAVYKTSSDTEFVGFNANTTHASRVESGINDGSLVLKLFYDRERYTVSFETGAGSSVSPVTYKYGQAYVAPTTTREYYKVEGWYTAPNGAGTKINAGDKAGEAFETATLYAKWVLDWNEKVVFTANVVEEDPDNDMFSVLVDVSNNPVGISSYELTLGFDNNNVVAVLDGGKVVTDLNGLGGAAITTNADGIDNDADAATLDTITVSWDNGTQNKSGNANLFKIRFKIIGTKADEDLELSSGGYSMFRMRRAVSLIPGLESLPFTLTATKVEITEDDGNKVEPEKETIDDGLEPYAIEHYKENAEDDGFTKVYTQYGHAVLDSVVVAEYRQDYSNAGFRPDYVNSIDKAQIVEGGAILKLYYERLRYAVNFDYQGATTAGIPSVSLKVGANVWNNLPSESTFEKTDWNFNGWYTGVNGTGTKVTNTYKVPVGGVTLYAYWTQTPYKVEHYKEALDGSFDLTEDEELQAKAGTVVTATAKTYLGFDAPSTMPSATVAEDGSTVIKVYYTRKTYTINYDFDGGWEVEGPASTTFKYGETITLPKGNNGDGQIVGGWFTDVDGNGTQVTDTANIDSILSTLSGNTITLYAYWVDDIGEYSIEFYQQNVDGMTYPSTPTEALTGLTGAVGTYVEVDKNSAAIKDKYFGFNVNGAISVLKKKLTKTGTVLKVYYDRKTYTVDYNFDGGEADGTYKTTFKYGQEYTLANAVNSDGTTLEGWYTQAEGNGTKFGNGGAKVTFTDAVLETFTNDKVTLYANWVEQLGEYTVEFYQENVEGTEYVLVAADTLTGLTGTIGKVVKVDAASDEIKNKYVGFSVNTSESELSKTLAASGTVLKVYYDRNVYTLNYNYSGADTEGIASQTFKYGQNITFPDESTFGKESFNFAGWYTTQNFADDEVVYASNTIEQIVDVANGETEATIYAKWAATYTVTFREAAKIGTYIVDPAVENTVPYSAFPYDQLVERYKTGYFENASVSDVYAGNEYTHTFEGDWYYTDENGEEKVFTDKTIVDRDLTVRYKFRYVRLELFVEKLGQNVVFEVPFEESTRLIDTFKDELFVNQQKILIAADEIDARGKFMALNLKLVNFLESKGINFIDPGTIFAPDGEILKQQITFNGFAYLSEETVKTYIVKTIRQTLKDDPLRLRGVVDEMMVEQDPDVINTMDEMLVSMLSGSDAARIKGIIAEAVEDAVANDTTGEFKNKIKDIIVAQLNAGNVTVENSVKDAIADYFMNTANDGAIKDIVKDLIDQAFTTNDDNDPVRKFVKGYIVEYLNNNHDVLDDMIRELGANLENDSDPVNQHVIELIKEMLMDDANEAYLEELVDDAVENLHNKVGTDLYNFMIDAITEELVNDPAELETLVRAIADTHVDDLTDVLKTVMEDDATFETIVTSAISDETVFNKVLTAALDDVTAFETIVTDLCEDEEFYNIIVDIALSNATLKAEIKDAVIENDDALVKVIKEVASDNTLKEEIIDELLAAGDAELKAQLSSPLDPSSEYYADVKAQALSQAEAEIINIIETGINEIDHPEYWPIALEKAMEVAEANVRADLIALGVDPNGSLWDTLYNDAMALALIDVTAELNGGITDASDYYAVAVNGAKEKAADEIANLLATGIAEGSKYWDVAYQAAKDIAKDKIVADFDTKVDEIKTNTEIKDQVRAWAENAINKPEVEDAIKDLAKGLATSTDAEDIALKSDIVETVIDTVETSSQTEKDALVDDIIEELLIPSNAAVKTTVINKAIEVINANGNETLKADLIDSVLADVFADATLKDDLVDELLVKIQTDAALKQTVVDEAINAVVYDDIVNAEAIKILNELIETDDQFKENIVINIIDYILEEDQVRAQAMEKVIIKIESSDAERNEAIEFAFDVLEENTTKRAEIADSFLENILSDNAERENLATDVIDIMFDDVTLRDEILDIGFEQMFASEDAISEIVELAIDQLVEDDQVRRDMILAVIETEDGREGILDILFDELERNPSFIDTMVDIAMNGKYGDLVAIFAKDLVNEGKIQINPDNRQIAEEIVLPMLDDITLDTVMEKLPAKVKDVLPKSVIEKVFNKFKTKARDELVEGIEEAKKGNSKDISVMVDNELDIINEVIVPLYNKIFPKVVDKAEDFYYYNENVYLKAMVDMIDPEFLLDNTKPASEGGTGYRLRSTEEYYEIYRNLHVLADDAAGWYLENISDEQINSAVDKVAGKVESLLTKLNGFVGGRIPVSKIDTVVNYTKKILDKRERPYNVTTSGTFDIVDKVYNKLIDIAVDKTGVDITKSTTIAITVDGLDVSVDGEEVDFGNRGISVSIKGYSFKLDSESITILNKTVNIDRFIQKLVSKIGPKSVTFKIINDAPYSYGAYVGNNYIRLAAEYK